MNNIVIEEYKLENKEEWNAFVLASNNGTMFHLQSFLDYHPDGRFKFHSLMFRRQGKLLAVLPGGFNNDGHYWSPIGASYGGMVSADLSFSVSLELIDSLMEYCRIKQIPEIFIIPPPIIYSKNYSQHFEYAMLYRKFDFELHYISHAIDLKWGTDFLNTFDKTARKTIHKILREGKLTIRESDDYESFNEILIDNKARHNVKPTHTLRDMLKLRELLPENLRLYLVYFEGKPIAGSLLFLCNSKVVLCFYNMLYYEYEYLKPIYLVMYETVRWAVENGYEWVDIGVSQDTSAADPMTPSIGLIDFKERFDSHGILRSTYHFKFR